MIKLFYYDCYYFINLMELNKVLFYFCLKKKVLFFFTISIRKKKIFFSKFKSGERERKSNRDYLDCIFVVAFLFLLKCGGVIFSFLEEGVILFYSLSHSFKLSHTNFVILNFHFLQPKKKGKFLLLFF